MKTIIAGSRHITDSSVLIAAIAASGFEITEVVSGGARGVDALGERYADFAGIPVALFPPDWKRHGRAAGPIRNRQMAEYGDALIAIWDGKSRGTKNMIETARDLGLEVYVHIIAASQEPNE